MPRSNAMIGVLFVGGILEDDRSPMFESTLHQMLQDVEPQAVPEAKATAKGEHKAKQEPKGKQEPKAKAKGDPKPKAKAGSGRQALLARLKELTETHPRRFMC